MPPCASRRIGGSRQGHARYTDARKEWPWVAHNTIHSATHVHMQKTGTTVFNNVQTRSMHTSNISARVFITADAMLNVSCCLPRVYYLTRSCETILQTSSLYYEQQYFAVHSVFDSRLLRMFFKKYRFLIGTGTDLRFSVCSWSHTLCSPSTTAHVSPCIQSCQTEYKQPGNSGGPGHGFPDHAIHARGLRRGSPIGLPGLVPP